MKALDADAMREDGQSEWRSPLLDPSDRAFRLGLSVVVLSLISALATYLILTGLTPIAPSGGVVLFVLAVSRLRGDRLPDDAANGLMQISCLAALVGSLLVVSNLTAFLVHDERANGRSRMLRLATVDGRAPVVALLGVVGRSPPALGAHPRAGRAGARGRARARVRRSTRPLGRPRRRPRSHRAITSRSRKSC